MVVVVLVVVVIVVVVVVVVVVAVVVAVMVVVVVAVVVLLQSHHCRCCRPITTPYTVMTTNVSERSALRLIKFHNPHIAITMVILISYVYVCACL